MSIEFFAKQNRLRVRLDECGDRIIPGKRGHLYFAGNDLCLMVTDGTVALPRRWKELGARELWLGDISLNHTGLRVQDVRVVGIPEENWRIAVKLARIRRRRVLTAEQREAGIKNLAALRRQPEVSV